MKKALRRHKLRYIRKKIGKDSFFLLTLCVTYVTIVNVTLDIDNSWMSQNLPAQTGSNLTAAVSITDDPSGNSSYSYYWEIILPSDVTVEPVTVSGAGSDDQS